MAELEQNRELVIGLVSAGVGLASGFAIGYLVLKRNMETKYAAIADQEISEMRNHYREAKSVAAIPKPDLQAVVDDLGYTESEEITEDTPGFIVEIPEPIEVNVFEEAKPSTSWDYSVEVKNRDETKPYVIHVDEFTQSERDYDQTTLTYFVGDDILCDERDSVVDDPDMLVGFDNLYKFGHGSNDANVVYVRNPLLSLDIEIIKSEGNYAAEVHGFIEHSEARRVKARRGFDDDEYS